MPATAGGIASDDDVYRRLQDRLGLEPVECPSPRARQAGCEVLSRPLGQCLDPGAPIRIGDEDEIPWLGESDGRGPVSGREDAFKNLGRDGVGEKTPADIAALLDDPVHGGALVGWERVLTQQAVCR